MHPQRAKAKAMMAAKIKGFATGGRVGDSDISEPKVGMMKGKEGEGKGFASGGMVMGMKAKHKSHKGKKAGTHINIINMPHGGAGAPPMGPPPGPGPGVGMIPPPVRPVAPAPMPGPMGMPPPGAGPMMRKNGGRVAFKKGGRIPDPVSKAEPIAKGSGPDKVSKSDPIAKPDSGKFKAGAGTGEGRIEKEESYGKNAGKAAKSSSTS